MKLSELENLGFLYEREGYSWLRRHVLNRQCRRQLRAAEKAGDMIEAANGTVAEQLHRYYRVPREKIIVRGR